MLCWQVLQAGDHIINNKKVDPKKAKARHGKIFVGGLTSELSDDEIKNHFAQFGTVSNGICLVKCPVLPWWFIPIDTTESFSFEDHTIWGDWSLYLWGWASKCVPNVLLLVFQIVEVEMPFDKTKNQRKGFCFITFESEQVVMELLKNPKQSISGKEVDVKKATPKPNEMGGMRGGRGGRGGRGRGRGNYGASHPEARGS